MLRRLTILIVLMILVSITAQAATPRDVSVNPKLTFSGTTATCTAQIIADYPTDAIDAKITLWYRATIVASWDRSATGYLSFSETARVTSGLMYRLTVTYWINDEAGITESVKNRCP